MPFVTSLGRKGGTAVTAAVINALLELAGAVPAERCGDRPRPPTLFEIVRGRTVPPRNPQGTREGYTTGACAAAAAQAACRVLARDERPEVVAVPSPLGFDLLIPINRLAYVEGAATAGVIKDGGDDPDVTHGAEVLVTVRRVERAGRPDPGRARGRDDHPAGPRVASRVRPRSTPSRGG